MNRTFITLLIDAFINYADFSW